MPRAQLLALVGPHAPPRKQQGRAPFCAEVMLRSHLRRPWFDLSDEAMEDALAFSNSSQKRQGKSDTILRQQSLPWIRRKRRHIGGHSKARRS